mgnify:CR=1 FL=1
MKIQELNRELETQKRYLSEGKSKTLDSRHIDKLAVDIVLFRDGVADFTPDSYRPFGNYWETIGGRWGGRFGVDKSQYESVIGWDPVHFEFTK